MSTIHFLNVDEGDCNIIQHNSNRVSVIDVCCAKPEKISSTQNVIDETFSIEKYKGNFNQKANPENPITYLKKLGVTDIHRYIQTHPDMDHMDGIKALFSAFNVLNFWDTTNNKEMEEGCSFGSYNEDDWKFYKAIRKSQNSPKVLHLTDGDSNDFYNSDGLTILSPSTELVKEANITKDYNDASYVILYQTSNHKIIFSGDSGEKTWNYIIDNHRKLVSDIDVLVAPHHGRKTGGNDSYLDVLRPKLTLFGNAKSEYLDYNAWNNRGLCHITNNQCGNIILDISSNIDLYISNKNFAEKFEKNFWSDEFNAYHIASL